MKNSFYILLFLIPIGLGAQVVNSTAHITVNASTSLNVYGDIMINSGEVVLEEGSVLSMGDNQSITVNNGGRLSASGSSTLPVVITSPGYFNFEVNSGGTIGAQHTIFERLGINGVFLKHGANVDPANPFYNCTFGQGVAGGTLLTVNTDQVFTVEGAVFTLNNWGGSYNVTKTVDQGEVHFVNATGGFAGTRFENDPFNRVFWGDELITHSIPLPAGWSGLSSYAMPANNDIADIFAPISDNFIIAQTMTQAYYPSGGMNTIGNWQPQSAYRVKMSAPDVVDISGEMETNKVLTMTNGWSLMPVIANQPVNVVTLFAGTDVQMVKDVAGVSVYWPAYGINTLGSLLPGQAYYAYLGSPGSITFPENLKNAWTIELPALKHPNHPWSDFAKTASTHIIAVSNNISSDVIPGDILGVFSQDDQCYGIVEIENLNGNFFITAYADDPTTPEKDGFNNSEQLFFKSFRPLTNEIFRLEVEYDLSLPQSELFQSEGLSAIRIVKSEIAGFQGNIFSDVKLYPNPAKGTFWLSGIGSFYKIEIINLAGQILKIINNEAEDNIEIDIQGIHPGMYQVRISGATEVKVIKAVFG